MRLIGKSAFLLLVLSAPLVLADGRPGGLPAGVNPGTLKVVSLAGDKPAKPLELPLSHTRAHIQVSGFVARATIVQEYSNPFEQPIEAVYSFPLPDQAAVDGMNLKVGDKTIRGLIKNRDEARRIYQQAKAQGKRTGLLEQERPNVFTQSVGNILPGDRIQVEISYVDILDFRDEGAFELVFPMVVGPRYIPGRAIGHGRGGWSPDTERVPDASRITPPVLKPGQRSGHDIELTVELDAAVPVRGVHSISHAVDIEDLGASRRRIGLHPSDSLPNKDFILRYQVAGEAPEATLITHHTSEEGGYFTLIALPPKQVNDAQTVPRDLIFILDTSGSMRGFPLDRSKQAMQRLIGGMRPGDRFNLVRFAGDSATLWPEPRPYSVENARIAQGFVESLHGAGGTEMRRGIVQALRRPADPERMRIAFLLTDGYVGNEAEILASIEKERRGARIFTLGVGSSVNRYLLDRAAQVGLGEAFYLRQDENADPVVERFFQRVDRPALAHIQVDWNGLVVSDLSPARIPDLWQGQPVKLHGRYRRGGEAQISIQGVLGDKAQDWKLQVKLPENQPENALMATVWARSRVKELMLEQSRGGDQEALQGQITELGLNYRILTQWTSFVAVEETVVNEGGEQKTLLQPVELPEGVDYAGVFGEAEDQTMPAMSYKQRLAPSMMRSFVAAPAPEAMPTTPLKASGKPVAANAAMAKDEAEPVPPAACRYRALSVSGGLRYPQVEQVLRGAWTGMCSELKAHVGGGRIIPLLLELAADGRPVRVDVPKTLAKPLADAIRRVFGKLDFGAVTGAGTARIELELILKP